MDSLRFLVFYARNRWRRSAGGTRQKLSIPLKLTKIVQRCQQYCPAMLHPIQAQQCCLILLTTLNSVGSTPLFSPVFINLEQAGGNICRVVQLTQKSETSAEFPSLLD